MKVKFIENRSHDNEWRNKYAQIGEYYPVSGAPYQWIVAKTNEIEQIIPVYIEYDNGKCRSGFRFDEVEMYDDECNPLDSTKELEYKSGLYDY